MTDQRVQAPRVGGPSPAVDAAVAEMSAQRRVEALHLAGLRMAYTIGVADVRRLADHIDAEADRATMHAQAVSKRDTAAVLRWLVNT